MTKLLKGQELIDHCDKFQKESMYECYHGFSKSYPCTECFGLVLTDAKPDITASNKQRIIESGGQP